MSRFAASSLDLSRLPPPEVVKDLSFDAILSDRLEDLAARLAAAGIDWSVGGLLTDPLAIAQREDAFRELLVRGQINDAAKSMMLAFASGATLDHFAADRGVVRRQIREATSDRAAVFESDAELRRRAQIAPEALATAGTDGSYEHHAKQASAEVVDVRVVVPKLGRVDVVLLARDVDGGPSDEARLAVRTRLLRKDVKPTTVEVVVRGASPLPYQIRVTLTLGAGPDPSIVRSAAIASIRRMQTERRAIGAAVPRSAIVAAAHVAGVERVDLVEPAADVAPAVDQVASCSALSVSTVILDG